MFKLPRWLKTRYRVTSMFSMGRGSVGFLPESKKPWQLYFHPFSENGVYVWFNSRADALSYVTKVAGINHDRWANRRYRWARFVEKIKSGNKGGWG